MLKHFSATVYVVCKIDGEVRVLLHMHKKHHVWLGLGGHVEANEDPVAAAKREAQEEAGIDVTVFSPAKKLLHAKYSDELILPAFMFDQQIDAHGEAPEHRHIDCIYFGTTKDPSKVTMKEAFRWFSENELSNKDVLEDTRYIAKKALQYYRHTYI